LILLLFVSFFLFSRLATICPATLSLHDALPISFVQRWLGRLGSGVIIGNAITERGNQHGTNTTRVTRRDGQWLLNGTKYYSTGTGYADWIAVAATGDDDQPISLTVPAEAP